MMLRICWYIADGVGDIAEGGVNTVADVGEDALDAISGFASGARWCFRSAGDIGSSIGGFAEDVNEITGLADIAETIEQLLQEPLLF